MADLGAWVQAAECVGVLLARRRVEILLSVSGGASTPTGVVGPPAKQRQLSGTHAPGTFLQIKVNFMLVWCV